MKKIAATIAVSGILLFAGCVFDSTSDGIYVVHNDNVVTNTVPLKGFNDESYVWESWQFSTNKVEKVNE